MTDLLLQLYQQNKTGVIFQNPDNLLDKDLEVEGICNNQNIFIQVKSATILYAYLNLKGFIPFVKQTYETIYITDKEYKRIALNKLLVFPYEETLVIKALINGDIIYIDDITKNIDYLSFDEWTLWHILRRIDIDKINSENELNNKLLEINYTKKQPSLLIHSCCGPCSSYVLDYLKDYFKITIFYSNSNIDTKEEFVKRAQEQQKIINDINPDIKMVLDEYHSLDYYKAIKGYEKLPEHSMRCYKCYEFRMEKTANYAINNHFDYFTTTLSISPYKDSRWINEIGYMLEKKDGINFLYSNFKLHGGYQKSIELSKRYHLYRQKYCGCIYSKMDLEKKEKGNGENSRDFIKKD